MDNQTDLKLHAWTVIEEYLLDISFDEGEKGFEDYPWEVYSNLSSIPHGISARGATLLDAVKRYEWALEDHLGRNDGAHK